ncbi:hypothetical protein [Sinomonas sp.]|uniref:hypothetical protein n=1 Tax=Sinomonas sp. TaxID=1914986 RepID=UPI003F7DC1CD
MSTNRPSAWIPELSKELRIDTMGVKLNAVLQAKRLGFDWATMTDEQSMTLREATREDLAAVKASAKPARHAK